MGNLYDQATPAVQAARARKAVSVKVTVYPSHRSWLPAIIQALIGGLNPPAQPAASRPKTKLSRQTAAAQLAY